MRSIPKVISGLDDIIPGSLDAIVRLYGRVFDSIVPVSRPEVAEMCKLYENCQRMMCIAYQDPPLLPNLSLLNKTKSSCCRFTKNPSEFQKRTSDSEATNAVENQERATSSPNTSHLGLGAPRRLKKRQNRPRRGEVKLTPQEARAEMRRLFETPSTRSARKIEDRIVNASSRDGFCRISTKVPNNSDRYIQVSENVANKFALLHQVLAWSRGFHADESQHISHLCSKPKCLGAAHVALETPLVNNSRKNYGLVAKCLHCGKFVKTCTHEPTCVRALLRYRVEES
ncbi:UDP-n-acetyl-D-mannosamine 6-dehydrogenase [Fusarium phyllophilum]|uniref:UDP-n-acetyl-D-mannosamine 6-dehydrogenase n=1 Tax=Fusarium phyllophilum TaxID=47803 RepID=A0A8H5N1I3_9HYPO|nr:UDP-n-acetyl-D-mannosamine 6-dehydrogenase [Fusarium phyllophilum]